MNFSDYIVSVRIEKAKLLMQNPGLKLAQISEMIGFHDVKYFSKVFKKSTPAIHRKTTGIRRRIKGMMESCTKCNISFLLAH
ncbi:helix-turn-helix domain-containing protein [Paenibacillus rhizoplanae]